MEVETAWATTPTIVTSDWNDSVPGREACSTTFHSYSLTTYPMMLSCLSLWLMACQYVGYISEKRSSI